VLILSEKDLQQVLSMGKVISAVEEGFRAIASGDTVIPERLHLGVGGIGTLLEMPAYSHSLQALGTKIVSVFPNNAERGIATVQSVYLLLDSQTGVPLSLMEGRFITGIRTAATSAVATRLMAAPGPKRLGLFGAGVQARFHFEAMIQVADVEEVFISSRTLNRASELAEEIRRSHERACRITSAEEAASTCDLICLCTSSPTPLFDGKLLRAGAHINAVGAYTPATRELDTEAVRRARVIIDARQAAGREAGELVMAISEGAVDRSHVKGDLADLVSGRVRGRESPDEITLFKSCGLAIEDLVTAALAYREASLAGTGMKVDV
jgi:ornithine cyclodeaminase/alanine dehydrogenase-like protein (mu-crystallin family)